MTKIFSKNWTIRQQAHVSISDICKQSIIKTVTVTREDIFILILI